MKTGIVIFAHGSSVDSANRAVEEVADSAARSGSFDLVEIGFLDFQPDLDTAVARLVEKGAKRVLVVPYFLTLGIHLQRDLPRIVDKLSARHRGIEVRVTPPLDGHPALVEILLDRVQAAMAVWD